jgi:protein subunit release factor B
MTSKSTEDQLRARMASLGITEDDLEENFILGSGSGGQKVNKTASCVQLLHAASSTEIKCQRERSRALNRILARTELCERLEERARRLTAERKAATAKRRRLNRKRSPTQKKKILADKRHQSRKKQNRGKPRADD